MKLKLTTLALVGATLPLSNSMAHAQLQFGRLGILCTVTSPEIRSAYMPSCKGFGTKRGGKGGKCLIRLERHDGSEVFQTFSGTMTPIPPRPIAERTNRNFSVPGRYFTCSAYLPSVVRVVQNCWTSRDRRSGGCDILLAEKEGDQWYKGVGTLWGKLGAAPLKRAGSKISKKK